MSSYAKYDRKPLESTGRHDKVALHRDKPKNPILVGALSASRRGDALIQVGPAIGGHETILTFSRPRSRVVRVDGLQRQNDRQAYKRHRDHHQDRRRKKPPPQSPPIKAHYQGVLDLGRPGPRTGGTTLGTTTGLDSD